MKILSFASKALLLGLSIAGLANSTYAFNRASDSTALWALKTANLTATFGATWDNTKAISTWNGVTLNATSNRVTRLKCQAVGITTIPTEFGNMDGLLYLNFAYNKIATLPAGFGSLLNLDTAFLSNNSFTSLPAEIVNLNTLEYLDLSNTPISSLPTDFGNLVNLKNLNLSGCSLTTLPSSMSAMTKLKSFGLALNPLNGVIPDVVWTLTSLYYLNLGRIGLQELPSQIKNLTSLGGFYVSGNELTALPPEIKYLTNVFDISFSKNNLKKLPDELWTMTRLQYLDVSNNQLTKIPEDISKLTSLVSLNVSVNKLSDLPECFKSTPKFSSIMDRIYADYNYLKPLDTLAVEKIYPNSSFSNQYLPSELTIAHASTQDKDYDQTVAAIITGTLSGFAPEDDVELTCSGKFSDANAGTGKTVSTDETLCYLTGAHAGIYSLTLPTLTANIRPIAASVTAIDTSKVYGAANPVFTYSTSGFLTGDGLTGALARNDGEDVDTYTISQGTLANANYDITFTGANFTITPAPLTVTATAETITLGKTPKLAYAITTGQLFGTDKFTGTLTADYSKVGSVDILQGTLSASDNYDLSYTSAKLTVNAVSVNTLTQRMNSSAVDLNHLHRFDLNGRAILKQ